MSNSKVEAERLKTDNAGKAEFKVGHDHDVTFWTSHDFVKELERQSEKV